MDLRSTAAARSTFSSTTRWTGTPLSTRSLGAAVQHLRLGGTKSEWVLLASSQLASIRTRPVTQVYVGFLGSRGGHAAISRRVFLFCGKIHGGVSQWYDSFRPSMTVYRVDELGADF